MPECTTERTARCQATNPYRFDFLGMILMEGCRSQAPLLKIQTESSAFLPIRSEPISQRRIFYSIGIHDD